MSFLVIIHAIYVFSYIFIITYCNFFWENVIILMIRKKTPFWALSCGFACNFRTEKHIALITCTLHLARWKWSLIYSEGTRVRAKIFMLLHRKIWIHTGFTWRSSKYFPHDLILWCFSHERSQLTVWLKTNCSSIYVRPYSIFSFLNSCMAKTKKAKSPLYD